MAMMIRYGCDGWDGDIVSLLARREGLLGHKKGCDGMGEFGMGIIG